MNNYIVDRKSSTKAESKVEVDYAAMQLIYLMYKMV